MREHRWLTCPSKTCCYAAVVIPAGADVWRIARGLDAPPWSFLMYFETPVARRDAFALDASPRRYRLALAKNPALRQGSNAACVFLLRTRTGHHRCGLGPLRPTGCLAFPLELVDGEVRVQPGHGCECREWSLADVDTAAERPLLEQRLAEAEAYAAIVADWNGEIGRTGSVRDFTDYCDYLLEAYDRLDAPASVSTQETGP